MAVPRNIVNFKGVGKGYGSRSVLRDITLGVAAGERIGVVGANGDGKSTLLRLIAGWVHDVARFNPFTAILEASRGFIAGEPTKILISAACLAVMGALTTLWARGGLRSAEAAG